MRKRRRRNPLSITVGKVVPARGEAYAPSDGELTNRVMRALKILDPFTIPPEVRAVVAAYLLREVSKSKHKRKRVRVIGFSAP
jgi:hypothetical protein